MQNFELVKGTGSFRGAGLLDSFLEKLFEVTYLDNHNRKICVRFEMYHFKKKKKNVDACKEVVRFLKDQGFFCNFHFTHVPAPNAETDALAQIKQLAELHQAGVLTSEEFEAKKAELLRRL
jgi:hypothetical protein